MKFSLRTRLALLLCVVGYALWMWGVNYPYVGIYNANNNYLSLAAKNYLRFGFTALKGFPTYFAGQSLPSPIPYYLHHPVLIFPLSAIPFTVFGFHNWVVHVTNFAFLLADIYLLYLIACLVWGKKVGVWVAGLAMVFPMTSFFWKYMFFEQGSLFFNLCVYYFFIRYLQTQEKKVDSLRYIFLFAFLSGLIDWGVLYLLIPFSVFFFSAYRNTMRKPFVCYLVGTGISLGFFAGAVYLLQGGFQTLAGAISVRVASDELMSHSFWVLRLLTLTVIRIVLYFTPLAVFWIGEFIRQFRVKKRLDIQKLTLLFFCLFGVLNIVFLPSATWGHSYFLFYLLPFFAFSGGIWFARREKKTIFTVSSLIVLLASSIAVNYLKILQVKKQLWKYEAAAAFDTFLNPYEKVGVVNFPGDVFEHYFFHPTVQGISNVSKLIITCVDVCTPGEFAQVSVWSRGNVLVTYNDGVHKAWLLMIQTKIQSPTFEKATPHVAPNGNLFLRIYRTLRDTLSVGQI